MAMFKLKQVWAGGALAFENQTARQLTMCKLESLYKARGKPFGH
jgi:hypothetical protein